jgi:hypothetical protein
LSNCWRSAPSSKRSGQSTNAHPAWSSVETLLTQALAGKYYESSRLSPVQLSRRLSGGHTSTRIYIRILLKRTVLGQVFHYHISKGDEITGELGQTIAWVLQQRTAQFHNHQQPQRTPSKLISPHALNCPAQTQAQQTVRPKGMQASRPILQNKKGLYGSFYGRYVL